MEGERPLKFRGRPLEAYRNPDTNPYVRLHQDLAEVVLADQAPLHRGRWRAALGGVARLQVEVGTGNGHVLADLARAFPEEGVLGIERRFKRVVQAATKLRSAGARHARIARYDAFCLEDLFADGEIDRMHLYHPDPWPKDPKRRLVASAFADTLVRVLAPGGTLRLKSDFEGHVAAMRGLCEGRPLRVIGASPDVLARGAPWEGDLRSGYQEKFDRRGVAVHALEVERL